MALSKHLKNIGQELQAIYGQRAGETFTRLQDCLNAYRNHQIIRGKKEQYHGRPTLTEEDTFLITYANSIVHQGEKPLQTLRNFLLQYVGDTFSGIHILPFFPSSSDGGFAVVDFRAVDESFGTWEDIQELGKNYRITADLVLNHTSVKSEWFQRFLSGDPKYQDYFLAYDQVIDTENVFRPRVHPLLTPFEMANGETKYVWTTFSEDQVDLNYSNPEVLLEMIEILLFYLSKGIEGIRLDAVAYLWKDPQTNSIHEPETYAIVRILRSVIEEVAPYAFLVSETNVPYKENISYMGNGHDQVHMVYGFDVPPLVAHSFLQEDASLIKQFCQTKECESNVMFFHFLASHDGIGLLGAENILSEVEIENLTAAMVKRGGYVSYKAHQHLPPKPYEINISFFDAISPPSQESYEANQRYIASQVFMLSLKGVPGVYIHSLLASRNNYEMVRETGIKRLINRAQLKWPLLQLALDEHVSRRAQVLKLFKRHIQLRKKISALSPHALQHVLRKKPQLFVVERSHGNDSIIVVINVSKEIVELPEYEGKMDLFESKVFSGTIYPYQVLYLQ